MGSYLIFAFTIAGIFLIAGTGLFILSGFCRQFSLTQGAYMALGGALCAYLSRSSDSGAGELAGRGMPFMYSFAIAALVVGILAALLGFVTVRMRGATAITASIASTFLVMYIIFRSDYLQVGLTSEGVPDRLRFGATDFANLKIAGHHFAPTTGLMILTLFLAFIVVGYMFNIARSPLVRSMKSIRDPDYLAEVCAVSPVRTVVSAHFLSGLTAGIAGALFIHVISTFDYSHRIVWGGSLGIVLSMQLLVFVVLGGMKKMWLSCCVVALLAGVSAFFVSSTETIDFFDPNRGTISPAQLTAIIGSLAVIAMVHLMARSAKEKM